MKEISYFETEDGKVFATVSEAVEHERYLTFLQICEELQIYGVIHSDSYQELFDKLRETGFIQ